MEPAFPAAPHPRPGLAQGCRWGRRGKKVGPPRRREGSSWPVLGLAEGSGTWLLPEACVRAGPSGPPPWRPEAQRPRGPEEPTFGERLRGGTREGA